MPSNSGKGFRGLRPRHVILDEIGEWNGDDTIVFNPYRDPDDVVDLAEFDVEGWLKSNLAPRVAEELQHADKREGEINAES